MLWAYITRLWTLTLPEYHTTRLNVYKYHCCPRSLIPIVYVPHSALSIPCIHDEKAHRPGNTTLQMIMRHVKPAKCMVSMNGDHYYDVT